jgi:thioredoxin 1
MIEITEENYTNEVLHSSLPVLAYFSATWCQSCKTAQSAIDAIMSDYKNKIKFVKIDTESNPAITVSLNIKGLPTVMIFKNHKSIAIKSGVINKYDLMKFIDENI